MEAAEVMQLQPGDGISSACCGCCSASRQSPQRHLPCSGLRTLLEGLPAREEGGKGLAKAR